MSIGGSCICGWQGPKVETNPGTSRSGRPDSVPVGVPVRAVPARAVPLRAVGSAREGRAHAVPVVARNDLDPAAGLDGEQKAAAERRRASQAAAGKDNNSVCWSDRAVFPEDERRFRQAGAAEDLPTRRRNHGELCAPMVRELVFLTFERLRTAARESLEVAFQCSYNSAELVQKVTSFRPVNAMRGTELRNDPDRIVCWAKIRMD